MRSAQSSVEPNAKSTTKRHYDSLPDVSATRESKATAWVYIGPKLAGLYAAYGIATAALKAAKLVLSGIDAAAQAIPIDMDPRIVGLMAVWGTATVALKAAEGILSGAQEVVKAGAFIAEQITRLALGELFDIRYAMFEGDFGGPENAKRVKMQLKLVFLKQNLEVGFDFDFNDIIASIGSLVTNLIENHT